MCVSVCVFRICDTAGQTNMNDPLKAFVGSHLIDTNSFAVKGRGYETGVVEPASC